MLSQEAIEDLKTDCTFEEIQSIQAGLRDIENWDTVTHAQVRAYIDNEIFGKYKIHA